MTKRNRTTGEKTPGDTPKSGLIPPWKPGQSGQPRGAAQRIAQQGRAGGSGASRRRGRGIEPEGGRSGPDARHEGEVDV